MARKRSGRTPASTTISNTAWPSRWSDWHSPNHRMMLAVLAIAGAGMMEILQQWVPGRHAYFSDFVINGLGACAGIAGAALLDMLRRRA
ncbi:MAG TPA: VanZ family protein [Xanthobacteraceae bacterium]|nr:VanZ family protein [Xanthobacteraceae bacterium]